MEQNNKIFSDASAWEEITVEEVSVDELDNLTRAYLEARDDYDKKKKISNEADTVCKEKARQLTNLLEKAGKKNWEIEEGKAITVEKWQFTTPKDVASKQAFSKWLQEKHGKESFWEMFGINSMSLNSFLKQEIENNPEERFPGIEDPTHSTSIQFRRRRK